jgi:hypothetical protein
MKIEQLREVELMVSLPGWQALKGALELRAIYLVRMLILPMEVRPAKLSDEYIRGELQALRSVLDKPVDLLEELRDSIAEAEAENTHSEREHLAMALGMRRGGFPNGLGQPEDEE